MHTVLKLYGLHAEGKIRITSLSQYLAAFRTRKKKTFSSITRRIFISSLLSLMKEALEVKRCGPP